MKVDSTTTISAQADDIWKTIRAYDKVESFNPMVISSTITGTDEGSTRVCQVQLGDQKGEVVENLDSVDEKNKKIKISVTQGPPPLGGLQVTVQVKSLEDNKSQLLISTDVPNGDNQISAGLRSVFQMIGEGLKKLHEKEVI